MDIDRRDFIKLVGIGSVVIISGIGKAGRAHADDSFFFLQLSDTHWGFSDPKVNPDAAGTLPKAITSVNSLKQKPDFIMFTGDLTQTTDDEKLRRRRLAQFRDIVSKLKVKNVRFMPGEHDAGLDEGAAFKELFGATHYTFDHKGVHFIILDNVSNPSSAIGDVQLQWLSEDLGRLGKNAPIVVFTHRPLFDLYPDWDWNTLDGPKALELLMPYNNVTVFYGHIHQVHHFMTGHIPHYAAKGLMYPLPAPGSVPKKMPLPWDAAMPYKNLGFRGIDARGVAPAYKISEFNIKGEKI